jgi:hypothetical protein
MSWASLRVRVAGAKARLLASRVDDDQVRKSANEFVQAAGSVDSSDPEKADEALTTLQVAYIPASDRTGELLRERY